MFNNEVSNVFAYIEAHYVEAVGMTKNGNVISNKCILFLSM